VSAGRNSGIRVARGRFLILLSDDLLVPEDFISSHVHTLDRFPATWVVGGFRQLDELTRTPFGRYLDELERGFEETRKGAPLGRSLWELDWPTARNLSLPRSDLDDVGLFDERFRTTCEDQDLAERARALGIRFLYNASIECLHNDQAGDLDRYCSFQRRGASDTVLLLAKSPGLHGGAAIAKANARIKKGDSPREAMRKFAKAMLATPPLERTLRLLIGLAERLGPPESLLRRGYRLAIGTAIFRGWREGMRRWGDPASDRTQAEVRAQSRFEGLQPR
jgi:GT2 family glycosyltransferase